MERTCPLALAYSACGSVVCRISCISLSFSSTNRHPEVKFKLTHPAPCISSSMASSASRSRFSSIRQPSHIDCFARASRNSDCRAMSISPKSMVHTNPLRYHRSRKNTVTPAISPGRAADRSSHFPGPRLYRMCKSDFVSFAAMVRRCRSAPAAYPAYPFSVQDTRERCTPVRAALLKKFLAPSPRTSNMIWSAHMAVLRFIKAPPPTSAGIRCSEQGRIRSVAGRRMILSSVHFHTM